MRCFSDTTADIDEPISARMNFQTKERIKNAIHRAAALSGADYSAFTINAAYQSAIAMIAAHESTMLKPVGHQAFFDALDNSPAPTVRLRDALRRHGATVVSKYADRQVAKHIIEPLDPNKHDRAAFSFGVPQVDNFFRKTANKLSKAVNLRVT